MASGAFSFNPFSPTLNVSRPRINLSLIVYFSFGKSVRLFVAFIFDLKSLEI